MKIELNINSDIIEEFLEKTDKRCKNSVSQIICNMLLEVLAVSNAMVNTYPDDKKAGTILSVLTGEDGKLLWQGDELYRSIYQLRFKEYTNTKKVIDEYAFIQKIILEGAVQLSAENDAPKDDEKWN